MATDEFSFLALDQEIAFLAPEEYTPDQFAEQLNEDYELEPAWEAAGIVAVVENVEDRPSSRKLHVPKELPYPTKTAVQDVLAERLDFEAGAVPLVEQPPRSALCDVYKFERDDEAEWKPGDVPTFRSVMGSTNSLSERVASRFMDYCYGIGPCDDYDGFYPDFSEYSVQQFHLMGS